jgi:hypothetical protein
MERSVLAIPPVHGLMTTVVDKQRDLRDKLSWVNLSLESSVSAPTSSMSPHRRKEPSCTALTAASRRFSRKMLLATNKEPSSMVENIPGWKVRCTILWGLGILASKMSPPAADSAAVWVP